MRTVARPEFEVGETFRKCNVGAHGADLRRRLELAVPDVEDGSEDFADHAEEQNSHLVARRSRLRGLLTGDELRAAYRRMSGKRNRGRPVYDAIKLLPDNGTCPYCDHGTVSTLDHFLPKTHYPILCVTPDNLVGCCKDCNTAKAEIYPTNASDAVLHPYFDDVTQNPWLVAHVVQGAVPAVVYRAEPQEDWSDELNNRVAHHFRTFELGTTYSKQAARTISGEKRLLTTLHRNGGVDQVRSDLNRKYESWCGYSVNCWQAVMYQALSESDWYCETGHAL